MEKLSNYSNDTKVKISFPISAGLLVRNTIRSYWDKFKYDNPDIPLIMYEKKHLLTSEFYFKSNCTVAQARVIENAYNNMLDFYG